MSTEPLKYQVKASMLAFPRGLAGGLLMYDKNGQVLLFNDAATAITGLTKEQLNDKRIFEDHWRPFFVDESSITHNNFPPLVALRDGKAQKNVRIGWRKANGSIHWILMDVLPLTDPTLKTVSQVVCFFQDITAWLHAKQSLLKQEDRWENTLNATKTAVFLVDTDYFIILANEYAKRMLSLSGEYSEINEATNLIDKLPPERKGPVKRILDEILVTGNSVEYEIEYKKEDGSELWLSANYQPIRNDSGEIESICITAYNINHQKNREASLLHNEKRWKSALDGTGDGVWEYNFITRESYYSPLYKAMLGFADDEFPNDEHEWRQRLHPDDLPKILDIDRQYEKNEISNHQVEYRIRNKEGRYIWVLDRGNLLERTKDGRPLRLIGTHTDITVRKVAEETLVNSEQRFSSFMANTPTMTWIIDEHAVFRYLNEPYKKAFNLTDDHIGKSIFSIFPRAICDQFIKNNWRVWSENKSIETIEEGVGINGEQQFYQIFKFPLQPENGVRMLGGVALDITKKLEIEQQLAAEEEKKKREIIQAIINAQEKERKELAYELHDNVNQVLTSSKLMLEVAAERPELSAEFINRSLAYLNNAIIEIRKISHALTPGTLQDISLDAAIGEVIQNINTSRKLKVNYQNSSLENKKDIPQEIQLSALRIVQEQLNNIIKHSGAKEATVVLEIGKDALRLSVRDNGCGFDPETTRRGLGLNNIFNRVEYYHGTISLESSPGNGTYLQLEIPIT